MNKGMLFLSATVLLVLASQVAAADVCRALVLSNGGDKGAYQAGAIQGLVSAMKGEDAQWDVITGVGAGALNAGVVGSYEKGTEAAMAADLVKQWKGISSYKDIYQSWWLGLGEGLLYKNGLYDTTPLENLIKSKISCNWKRKVSVVATNLDLAQAEILLADESNDCETTRKWFLASSSIPVTFPYVKIGNHSYVDGGVLINLDVGTAIERCLEMVDSEDKIVIDVILANTKNLEKKDTSQYRSYEMLMRYLDIASFIDTNDDIIHAKVDYPNINFRYLVKPSKDLPSNPTPLDFGPKGIADMLAMGLEDGKAAVAAGPKVTWDHGVQQAHATLSGFRSPAKFDN